MPSSLRRLLRILQAVLLILRLVLWLLGSSDALEPAQPPHEIDVSGPGPGPGAVSPPPPIG